MEAAAAMEAVSASPGDPGDWWEVVQAVQYLYTRKLFESGQLGVESAHPTTNHLISSATTMLMYVVAPDALQDPIREAFAERLAEAEIPDDPMLPFLQAIMELTGREQVDAIANNILLCEFLLHHTASDDLHLTLLRGIANDRTLLFHYTGSEESLRIAIAHLRQAMDLQPDDAEAKLDVRTQLVLPLWLLTDKTHDVAELEELIDICHELRRVGTLDERHIATLTHALALWTKLTQKPTHIDEYLELSRQVMEHTEDEEEWLTELFDVGDVLVDKFRITNDLDALREGVAIQQLTLRRKGSFGSGHDRMIRRLADHMHLLAVHDDNDVAINEEINLRRGLLDMAVQEGDALGREALRLASALAMRASPEAAPWCVLVLLTLPAGQPEHAEAARLLAGLTEPAARPKRRLTKLSSTVDYARIVGRVNRLGPQAVPTDIAGMVRDLPARLAVAAAFELSTPLMHRFADSLNTEDADAAIQLFWAALLAAPSDDQPVLLESLAHVHDRHYAASEDLAQLEAAIAARRVRLHFPPTDPTAREEIMALQAAALRERCDVTGITANQLEFGPDGEAFAMRECALIAGEFAVRTRNFEMGWFALDLLKGAEVHEPERFSATCQKMHASLYHLLSKDSHRTADLRLAILLYRKILEQQEEPDADVLNGLGTALYEAAEQSIPEGDVNESIALLRRAYAMDVPAELRGVICHNLANAVKQACGTPGDVAGLDEAIELHREALTLVGEDHAQSELLRASLEDTLRHRSARLGIATDAEAAPDPLADTISRLQEIQLQAVSTLPRAQNARRRLRYRWGTGNNVNGVAVAESLFDTVSAVMWELSPGDRQETIGRLQYAASDAAAVFLTAGMPEKAIEILEHGRNLQWSQMLRARTEIAALRRYRWDLAEELSAVLESRDTGFDISVPWSIRADDPSYKWERLVESVRSVPGFEHFLDARPYSVLRAAGDEGPVVIVNTAPLRCDALILDHGSLIVVELPFSDDDSHEVGAEFVAAGDLLEFTGPLDEKAWAATNETACTTMAWLWTGIVAPVLSRLALPENRRLPRLWWCPTGALTFLPLHAAGDGDQTLLTRVVSSYTRSLWSLIEARAHRHSERVRLLLVSVPNAPDNAVLHRIEQEAEVVARSMRRGSTTALAGPAATKQAVLAELASHTWLHLAGHGGDPAIQRRDGGFVRYSTDSGGLRLIDGELDPREIAGHDLGHVTLAIIMACKASASDIKRSNEALHPAGALQAAGCQQVVASLWSISDAVAPAFVSAMYERLTTPKIDARHGARAVHAATMRLRRDYPDDPLLWISFIHSGI